MTQLRAFVGHSFTHDDENVVRAFLKLLDQVKGMNPGFSWEHAEPAEAKDLAPKVLGLIEDKNLFIGICTRKEAVVNLTQNATNKKDLKIKEDQLIWKTSDWIIQEIGLAIGRKMDLILLVEEGIRQPGGLQGNHESVSFDRQNPEKAYGKILEMIKSLMPRAKTVSGQETSIPSSTEQELTQDKKQGDEWLQPGPDWLRSDFDYAIFHMIASDETDGVKRISDAYLATEDGTTPENRASWEAHQEYTRLSFGKGGELSKLKELATAHKGNSQIQRYLARGYLEYKENDMAAHSF